MNGNRLARNVSAGMVAAIAAWSSYSHMTEVALRLGQRPEVAYVLAFLGGRADGRRERDDGG